MKDMADALEAEAEAERRAIAEEEARIAAMPDGPAKRAAEAELAKRKAAAAAKEKEAHALEEYVHDRFDDDDEMNGGEGLFDNYRAQDPQLSPLPDSAVRRNDWQKWYQSHRARAAASGPQPPAPPAS